jgi:hypothetical protein
VVAAGADHRPPYYSAYGSGWLLGIHETEAGSSWLCSRSYRAFLVAFGEARDDLNGFTERADYPGAHCPSSWLVAVSGRNGSTSFQARDHVESARSSVP